jgi:alkanesulfonate monooxygenase SsuD/methylene tetrahydromethanopterin reductase-like flavin-dependent oxidoreductase (luciferase family)
MWADERFSYSSPNLEFPPRIMSPRPFQDPHPPVWQAATSDSSAVSAGRYGLGLLSLSLSRTVERMTEVIAMYHAAQAESEPLTHVRNDRVGAYTLVHCCDDLVQAESSYKLWESVEWWYRSLAEFIIEWELPNLTKEAQERAFPLLHLSATNETDVQRYQEQDMIIIGTPEMCLEKMIRYDEAGVDQLLCYMQFGSLPHESVMHSVELLAEHVIPELERRGHRVSATAVAV